MLVAVLALALHVAAPALAHPEEEHAENKTMKTGALAEPEEGSPLPDPPRYAFRENGTVVIDGDVFTDCPSFASSLDREEGFRGDVEQARGVLERCEEAGLLPPEGTFSSASVGASASTGASASASASSSTAASASPLPTTGGPVSLVALAPLALLAGSGLLAFKVVVRS